MLKNYFLKLTNLKTLVYSIAVLFLFTSCNEESIEPTPQYQLFRNQNLTYEYYYAFEDWEQSSLDELQLQLVEGLNLDNNFYYGFSNSGNHTPSFDLSNNDDILDFNFLPIRYENGNYFELRSEGELIILKDNMNLGDNWEHIIEIGEDTLTYTFEVVQVYDTYNANSYQYDNVFQVNETVESTSTGYDVSVSMHFYNKDFGIIRREIPQYVSGTYGPIVFNLKN